MSFLFELTLLSGGLFLGMLLFFEVGRRIGIVIHKRNSDGVDQGSGPLEAAIFGLLGLLLALTFSGAASRFEDRRHLIVEEANAIGTAYLRIDLLPPDTQPELRQLFARYLDTRLNIYQNSANSRVTKALASETAALQGQIWFKAVSASQQPKAATQAAMLMLPALNEMIDITTTRAVAMKNHPPRVIYVLLATLNLVSALLAGYIMHTAFVRNWFYLLLFATTMSLTFFVILDLEYPRFGLIRIDDDDQTLAELRNLIR